jgi:hypothetical protein
VIFTAQSSVLYCLDPGRYKQEELMKLKIIIAVILITLGIAGIAYQGITYTTREKVIDVGPIHVTAEKTKSLPLPPILGAMAIAGGIVLLLVGTRKS